MSGRLSHNPIRNAADVEKLKPIDVEGDLSHVLETIRILDRELDVPLITFAGAPFTIASYLIEGRPSKSYIRTKTMMYSEPEAVVHADGQARRHGHRLFARACGSRRQGVPAVRQLGRRARAARLRARMCCRRSSAFSPSCPTCRSRRSISRASLRRAAADARQGAGRCHRAGLAGADRGRPPQARRRFRRAGQSGSVSC